MELDENEEKCKMDPDSVSRQESFKSLKRHSQSFIDEINMHFNSSLRLASRRNAIEGNLIEKLALGGISGIATKMGKTPTAELKEGRLLPLYLARSDNSYNLPACCYAKLKDPDDFYKKTYIVVNKQGTIFRFSKTKSLFLLDADNKLRSSAVNLLITPLFAHFITFVILVNCIFMIMIDPPKWSEDYLEYVFTAIYLAEAMVKIIARGFFLHPFSYLRNPWNWLDFSVIVTAITTEILQQTVSSDAVANIAVLRAFRVIRAFKTMAIVPGLRAIVKALLRSIKALKDVVLLTIFCVSVFALIGYQLFHGTMRQKCVRYAGTLESQPDSMFLYLNASTTNWNLSAFPQARFLPGSTLKKIYEKTSSYRDSSNVSIEFDQYWPLFSTSFVNKKLKCYENLAMSSGDGKSWSNYDAFLLQEILDTSRLALNHALASNASITFDCNELDNQSLLYPYSTEQVLRLQVSNFSALLWVYSQLEPLKYFHQKEAKEKINPFTWNCTSSNFRSKSAFTSSKNHTNESLLCDVAVYIKAASIPYLNKLKNECADKNASKINLNIKKWFNILEYGSKYKVPRWPTRDMIVQFQLMPWGGHLLRNKSCISKTCESFIYFAEANATKMSTSEWASWKLNEDNYCKKEPRTGLFYYFKSPNRPKAEPIYCAIKENDCCPLGYKCIEAGRNPDFGFTCFDDFLFSFLTSLRLVSLDAWSRVYHVTLLTSGPGYVIFYVVIVLLGSYYLINLIVAVVYMAYEEQQAVAEEEELEAEEREMERIEEEIAYYESSTSDVSGINGDTEKSDIEMGLKAFSSIMQQSPRRSSSRNSSNSRQLRRRSRRMNQISPSLTICSRYSEDGDGQTDSKTDQKLNANQIVNPMIHSASYFLSPPNYKTTRLSVSNSDDSSTTKKVKLNERRYTLPKRGKKSWIVSTKKRKNASVPTIRVIVTQPTCDEITDEVECYHQIKSIESFDTVVEDKGSGKLFPVSIDLSSDDNHSDVSSQCVKSKNDQNYKGDEDYINDDKNFVPSQRISSDHFSISNEKEMTLSEKEEKTDEFNKPSNHSTVHTLSPNVTHSTSFGSNGILDYQPNEKERRTGCNRSLSQINIPVDGLSDFPKEAVDSLRRGSWNIPRKTEMRKTMTKRFTKAFVNIFGKWQCCPHCFTNLQSKLRLLALNSFTDLLITFCIALNTVFMTLEHHPMEDRFGKVLEQANMFFTMVFAAEMIIKIIGLTPYRYFRERWNLFDAVVVLFSLIELCLSSMQGMSILRAFRLMRIVKLAKQWPTLNKLLQIIGRTLGKMWNLTIVLLLFLYIFAVVGMQLLRKSYLEKYHDNLPRWNFIDFPHAFMMVFRIQCGEWVESMFICLNVASPGICFPLFLIVYIIGNLVILNLFLALLLNSFSGDILQRTTTESNSISEAILQVKRWLQEQSKAITTHTGHCCQPVKRKVQRSSRKSTKKTSTERIKMTSETDFTNLSTKQPKNIEIISSPIGAHSHNRLSSKRSKDISLKKTLSRDCSPTSYSDISGRSAASCVSRTLYKEHRLSFASARMIARERYRGIPPNFDYDEIQVLENCPSHHQVSTSTIEQQTNTIKPCLPFCWEQSIFERGCFHKLRVHKLRVHIHRIIHHRFFDAVVIFCILLSSVTLAMDDIHINEKPVMKRILKDIDLFCCVFFALEMCMKWIGDGWKQYFTDPWCILDFFIVIVSVINLCITSQHQNNFSALRALRTFRAFRPLRALSRFKGMKIVVDALIRAIPSIAQVFLVCMVFWLIFSILGVNLFGGRFGRCVALTTHDILPRRSNESMLYMNNATLEEQCSPNNTRLLKYLDKELSAEEISSDVLPSIRNKSECEKCAYLLNTTAINWQVPDVNFDNVARGFLALIQVATFNGWLEIMDSATDITGVLTQPSYDASFYYYIYFGIFIIFGAFFSLNLFIGVIIDNFNQQKLRTKGGEDGVFLTEEQRRYYYAVQNMASKTPTKPIPRPTSKFVNKVYDIVTSRKFEIGVMGIIMLNVIVMALEHHDISQEMDNTLAYFNLGFLGVFLLEVILKLIGLRKYYFYQRWNIFDFAVVIASLLATAFRDFISQYLIQPTLFRIIRLFRVTRVLRLIRQAKGIRTLLFALMMSLPALLNIGSLLFLIMSIYATIGMSQFPHIKKVAGVNDLLNFETFPNAMLVLFQISTSEGWDKFIYPVLHDTPPYCDLNPKDSSESNCGNSTIGSIYFVTYVMTTFLIVVNMYIAIILENFEVATRENAEPITADDFEQFFEVWQRYDDRLSQFVSYEDLLQLLPQLDHPLRISPPISDFIVDFGMRITRDGRVHCLEVVIALIKKVLGDSPELQTLREKMVQYFADSCNNKVILEEIETMEAEDYLKFKEHAENTENKDKSAENLKQQN